MSTIEETDEALRLTLERALARELRMGLGKAERMVSHWLNEVRAKAWEEGHEAAAMRVPEGVWHDTAAPRTPNPYREEQDA